MWEHCRWWLNQITDSVSLSFPLWTCIVADETTNSNVSFLFPHSPRTLSVFTFHIHVTTCVFTNTSSPQDCLLWLPSSSSSTHSFQLYKQTVSPSQQTRSDHCHATPQTKQKRLNHFLTTYLQRPLFLSYSICYILTLPEAQTFYFWKGPLRRRAGELPGSGPFCWSLRTTVLLSFFYLLSSSTLVPKPHRAGCQILAKLIWPYARGVYYLSSYIITRACRWAVHRPVLSSWHGCRLYDPQI